MLDVRRRELIALLGGAAAAWPLAARAQQAPRAARLSYLAPASNPELQQALLGGLRDLGYEGQNLAIEYRFMLGQSKSYDELAERARGTRRRDMISAVNRLCEMAGMTPASVRADWIARTAKIKVASHPTILTP
jgi:hypothetical protein